MTITPQQYIETRPTDLAAARREQLLRELARCNHELLEIDHRADIDSAPAYLVELGRQDWLRERHLIEQKLAEPGGSSPSGVSPKPGTKRRGGRRGCFRTRWVSAPCDKCGTYAQIVHSPIALAGFWCERHCPICAPQPEEEGA